MAESQDVNALRRRGRRRLVGAIALVLAAVIVLPWIFDPQPRQAPPVSVRIPGEDETPFVPKSAPKPPAKAEKPAASAEPAPAAPAPGRPDAKPVDKALAAKPAAKVQATKPTPASASAERVRAEAALANAPQFYVPVGAYADPGHVIARLRAAKLAYFTEPVATAKGTVTRVRAGPFASREAAEKAQKQLKGLGFAPGNVATRS
jgi:DedD protein